MLMRNRYLISSSYVVPQQVHYSMVDLAMSYLNLPQVSQVQEVVSLRSHLFSGLYGLLDYSSACWVIHLKGSLAKSNVDMGEQTTNELTVVLEEFVDLHWSFASKKLPVSASTKKILSRLSGASSLEKVSQAVTWSKIQLGVNSQAPSDEEALNIWKSVESIRGTLEALNTFPIAQDKRLLLEHHYGVKHFKCPRISCYYYHEGFTTAGDRNTHVDKHEKPFLCVISSCLNATFGYTSKSELMRHAFEKHGLDFNDDWDYPTIEDSSDNPDTPSQQSSGKFVCAECGQNFTRNHTLKIHAKKHAGDIAKPYKCSVCGMAFPRPYDRDRHERQHGGEKLLCYGKLDDGTEWGCKAQFTRRDKREDHFRSKKGQQCIMLFAKQKLLRDAEAGSQESSSNSLAYNGDVLLPRFSEFLSLCGLHT